MKTMVINGEHFEVIRPRTNYPNIGRVLSTSGCGLYDYYSRPSVYKQGIYEDWRKWYCNTDEVMDFGVSSANSQCFTLSALYVDPKTEEVLGVIKITRDHNRLYLL